MDANRPKALGNLFLEFFGFRVKLVHFHVEIQDKSTLFGEQDSDRAFAGTDFTANSNLFHARNLTKFLAL